MLNYKLQLMDYGPFTIPKRDKWLIVGSGPTAKQVYAFLAVNPGAGVISLNAELPGIPVSTIHIVGHYEYFLQCIHDLEKAEIIFVANPLAVGFRCQDLSAINLFDLDYFTEHYPWKIRFFEKEADLSKLAFRSHTLYCYDTIASTAVDLLSRNGIKEVYFCGIDGHELSSKEGRSHLFEEAYRIRKHNGRVIDERRYDTELKNFIDFSRQRGVTPIPFQIKELTNASV